MAFRVESYTTEVANMIMHPCVYQQIRVFMSQYRCISQIFNFKSIADWNVKGNKIYINCKY